MSSSHEPKARLTNADFAALHGVSASYIGKVRREGTPDRALAKDLAGFFGDRSADEYLRSPIRRGRPRRPLPFPLKEFVVEVADAIEGTEPEPWQIVARMLTWHYEGKRPPPDDFESLETFKRFVRRADFGIEDRDAAEFLWDEFKVWRLRKLLDGFIQSRDDVDDMTMRQLLSIYAESCPLDFG